VHQYFNPGNVEVIDRGGNILVGRLGLSYKGKIFLGEDLPIEKKIKTLLHELLHQDPKYGGPLGNKKHVALIVEGDPYHELNEQAIDQEMEETYDCQPWLVKYLEHRLDLMYHSEVRFIIERARGIQQLFYSYEYNIASNRLNRVF